MNERRIADAIIEADPVDPALAARHVALALAQMPGGRVVSRDIVERVPPRSLLASDALLIPPAAQSDVERGPVVERGARSGRDRSCGERKCKKDWRARHRTIVAFGGTWGNLEMPGDAPSS